MVKNTVQPPAKPARRKRNHKDVFVTRLRMLLDDPDVTTVSWHPSGKAVMIDKRHINQQVMKVFPERFGSDKFASIRQNLSAHGFKSACKRQNVDDAVWKKYSHVLSTNKYLHIYEHPLFRRDKREHDKLIKRVPIQRKKLRVTTPEEATELRRKRGKTKDAGRVKRDKETEKETARYGSDHQTTSRQEKMQWSFYSANEDDYKITEEDRESDNSQTPIAEEQESAETPDTQKSESEETQITIAPVQGLVSPVLDGLHGLADVASSITPVQGTEDWNGDGNIKPEIQTGSIWKPRTSPVGDPNAQPDKENESRSTDGKSSEVPLDLTIREKVGPNKRNENVEDYEPTKCERNKRNENIEDYEPTKCERNKRNENIEDCEPTKCETVTERDSSWYLNTTDDDASDDESFSTLAAFCQAKITALFPSILPDEETPLGNLDAKSHPANSGKNAANTEGKPPAKQNTTSVNHNSTNIPVADNKRVLQLVPINLPPPKKFKVAKPRRVKIDLSAPLCTLKSPSSCKVQQAIQERGTVNYQGVFLDDGRKGFNQPLSQPPEDSEEPETTLCSLTANIKTGRSKAKNSDDRSDAHGSPEKASIANLEHNSEGNNRINRPESNSVSECPAGSQVPTFLTEGQRSLISSSQELIAGKGQLFTPNIDTFHDPNLGWKPMPILPGVLESAPSVCVPVEINLTEAPSVEPDHGNSEKDHQGQSAVTTEVQLVQKLPSIDQIFKTLSKTPLESTPTVAANVEVSSVPLPSESTCNSLSLPVDSQEVVMLSPAATAASHDSTTYDPLPVAPMYPSQVNENSTTRRCARRRKGTRTTAPKMPWSQTSSVQDGWTGHSAINPPPYMYPFPPSHPPSYNIGWPSPYSWPHYIPMAGRYPYYPSIPSYNPFPK